MTSRKFNFQEKKLRLQLLKIFLLMLVGMTLYEALKQIIHPDISIWQSHIVTIIFSAVCATTAAFFILKKQIDLNSKLNSKNLENERLSRELKKTVTQLEAALTRIKPLTGLLPICSACNKIRDDNGYWKQMESYIRDHSDVDFSRSICPGCARKRYPDIFEEEVDGSFSCPRADD
jgi:hypothetical protein